MNESMKNETPVLDKIVKAQQQLGADMLNALLLEIRALPNVWQKLSEAQQADVLDRLCRQIDSAVSKAIVTLAAGEMATIQAEVESVTFKDGVKAVFAVQKDSPFRHDLADAQGNSVMIVLEDVKNYTQSAREVKPEPDQPNLKNVDTGQTAIEYQPSDDDETQGGV